MISTGWKLSFVFKTCMNSAGVLTLLEGSLSFFSYDRVPHFLPNSGVLISRGLEVEI